MITEIVLIDVRPGMEAEFEGGVAKATPHFKAAKNCHGMLLEKSIEKPSRYRLFVHWSTVEDHTVVFRNSQGWQEWRKCVGHCFERPPEVEHTAQVYKGF